jgi:hypothetical protein
MRCVIWHGATAELPGELLNSLSKRMLRMTVCTDAYSALAHCALIERTRQAEIRAGSVLPLGGVLVLVQPTQLARIAEAMESIHLYGPSIALWSYDRSANPKLRAVVDDDVASWIARMPVSAHSTRTNGFAASASVQAGVASGARSRPTLSNPVTTPANGAGHPAATGGEGNPRAGQTNGRRGGSLLTEEELRMLLAPDPREAARSAQRKTGSGGGV